MASIDWPWHLTLLIAVCILCLTYLLVILIKQSLRDSKAPPDPLKSAIIVTLIFVLSFFSLKTAGYMEWPPAEHPLFYLGIFVFVFAYRVWSIRTLKEKSYPVLRQAAIKFVQMHDLNFSEDIVKNFLDKAARVEDPITKAPTMVFLFNVKDVDQNDSVVCLVAISPMSTELMHYEVNPELKTMARFFSRGNIPERDPHKEAVIESLPTSTAEDENE